MTNAVDTLKAEKIELQNRIKQIREEIKAAKAADKGTGKPRGPRGPRNGVTATATIDQLLRTKGPLDASEIIATVACEGSNVQVTSVRTLISAMAKKGVIVKTGSRGTYKYEAVPAAVSAAE